MSGARHLDSAHHLGEEAVRERAQEAPRIASSRMSTIPAGVADFLQAQRMVVIGGQDPEGLVWATALTGPPGFAGALNERTAFVAAPFAPGEPLSDAFTDNTRDIGLLAIDPHRAQRIRINGRARQVGGKLVIRSDQVLGNCPKYIHDRIASAVRQPDPVPRTSPVTAALSASQQRWITGADTFFVASHSPGNGADASHRGGRPGFVQVLGARRLAWPDYSGNRLYMTLGNIHLSAACGLLFLDWEQGHALQLSGRAGIDWAPERSASVPGALRMVDFAVDQVVEVRWASPLRWSLQGCSTSLPPRLPEA